MERLFKRLETGIRKAFVKTKNILKLEEKIQQTHRKIANIRKNYLHQTTTSIVKTKPYRVISEDLNVKGMMKNKPFKSISFKRRLCSNLVSV